jgi:exonuclease SbcD
MKILHTSDWHIGRSLYGRKRYDEFEAFLNWLAELIQSERIDVLLVAGDVFDTSTPSNRAQELYYRFLCRVAGSCCRHVVVIAGNHDSPSFLNAPKELLRFLNVHVVGSVSESLEDEVFVLEGESGSAELIVCAVPYLRDRDIRTAEAGESIDDKDRKLIEGMRAHYRDVCTIAEAQRKTLETHVPIVAMGHLFAAGGRTIEGDGVRELYVGSLAHVSQDVFPECIDYLALGHLHVPQKVGGSEKMRYSGSPIPMGFGEAGRDKKVLTVEFIAKDPVITEIAVPCFQPLERIAGEMEKIVARIKELKSASSNAWLEIEYIGDEVAGNLRDVLDEAIADSQMEIRRVKNRRIVERVIRRMENEETLDDLDANDVFVRCLDAHGVPDEQRPGLIHLYQETLTSLYEADRNAE